MSTTLHVRQSLLFNVMLTVDDDMLHKVGVPMLEVCVKSKGTGLWQWCAHHQWQFRDWAPEKI